MIIMRKRIKMINHKKSTRMDAAFTIHSFNFRRRKMMENGSFFLEFVPCAKSVLVRKIL